MMGADGGFAGQQVGALICLGAFVRLTQELGRRAPRCLGYPDASGPARELLRRLGHPAA
jgi:hypothetical protein